MAHSTLNGPALLRRAKPEIWMTRPGGQCTILDAQGGRRGAACQRLQIDSGQHGAIALPSVWLKQPSITPSARQRIVCLRRGAPRAQCPAEHRQLIVHEPVDLGIAASEDFTIAYEHLTVFFA
jgi:hypothetical protein